MSKNTRLLNIASKINIGIDTIVDYLVSQGYEIENKPSSILTEAMVNVVMDKFKLEFKNVEKQRQKLKKIKKMAPTAAEEASAPQSQNVDVHIDAVEIGNGVDDTAENIVVEKEKNISVEKSKSIEKTEKSDVATIEMKVVKSNKRNVSNKKNTDKDIANNKDLKSNIEISSKDVVNQAAVETKMEVMQEEENKKSKSEVSLPAASPLNLFNDNLPKVGDVIQLVDDNGNPIRPRNKKKQPIEKNKIGVKSRGEKIIYDDKAAKRVVINDKEKSGDKASKKKTPYDKAAKKIVKQEKNEQLLSEQDKKLSVISVSTDKIVKQEKTDVSSQSEKITYDDKDDKKITIKEKTDDNLPKVGDVIQLVDDNGNPIRPRNKKKQPTEKDKIGVKSRGEKTIYGKEEKKIVIKEKRKKEQEKNEQLLSGQDKKLSAVSVSTKKDSYPKKLDKEKVSVNEKTANEVKLTGKEKDVSKKKLGDKVIDDGKQSKQTDKKIESRKEKRKNKDVVKDSDSNKVTKDKLKATDKQSEKKKESNLAEKESIIKKKEFKMPTEELSLKGLTILGKVDIFHEHHYIEGDSSHQVVNRTFRSRKDRDKDGKSSKDHKDSKHSGFKGDNKEVKDYKGNKHSGSYHTNIGKKNVGDKFEVRFDKNKIDGYKKNEYKTSPYFTKPLDKDKKVFTNDSLPKNARLTNYGKNKRKTLKREDIDFDVDKAIRTTLSGMEDTSSSSKKAKLKLKKKIKREEKVSRIQEFLKKESKILRLTEFVTTSDLAALINVKPNEIILKCMQLGLMVTINQRLDKDTLLLIASDYGLEVEFEEANTIDNIIEDDIDAEETLITRPPIVTIMGHVDHGKTSLLDFIRNTNIVAGEAGGITQHIGAYRVLLDNGKAITFLDTPGHEAFTAMRARGAQVTDIVVIVVAADDNVMPQTIEAISHARAANVPIIVAINKIDKTEANIDKIKQQLSEQSILVEDWGGKYQCVEISAKKGINIDLLLDKILLEAEMLNLRANPNRKAQGVIIESRMTKGWGNVASVVIQKGTLLLHNNFVAGANFGKIRALLDERGNKVKDVLPSQPIVVIGFDSLPNAGDTFVVVDSETEAREVATKRSQLRREQEMRKVRLTTLDDISAQISIGGVKDLNLIIKGDVAGSVEALSDSLLKLSTDEVRVNIILKQAGIITESDVMLAAASGAIVIGFNISSTPQAAKLAEQEQVEIRRYNIIYDCINEIHLALEGMLKPDIKEEIAATIEVRQTFKISKIGQIAGCYVTSGKVTRNDKIRIVREGFPIFTGTIVSLKRNKDDVKEVDNGYECGIQVGNFNTFEEGDSIEVIKYVEVKRTLEIKK
jgi:translation initiation factor IF-2